MDFFFFFASAVWEPAIPSSPNPAAANEHFRPAINGIVDLLRHNIKLPLIVERTHILLFCSFYAYPQSLCFLHQLLNKPLGHFFHHINALDRSARLPAICECPPKRPINCALQRSIRLGLLANLAAYTREASAKVALDLDGEHVGEGPLEPDVGPLLAAADEVLHAPPASARLSVPHAGYRGVAIRGASPDTVVELRRVLRDRTARDPDPRPLACALAALLNARALVPDLLALVQSPHPVVAAVARAAAQRLGEMEISDGTGEWSGRAPAGDHPGSSLALVDAAGARVCSADVGDV